MSKSNFNYKSLISVHGCPLLPPVIDTELSKQIRKYRDEAVALEEEISLRKISSSEGDCMSRGTGDLEGCSEGTLKLIEYIKRALRDVAHDSSVEKLQNQFFDDLKKFEGEKRDASSSSDTLHNVSTFRSEERQGSNTSSDAETLSPEAHHPEEVTPPQGRRRSFTLDTPSPALVRYFQKLTRDSLSDNSLPGSKSARNLNHLWDPGMLDMSTMVQKPADLPIAPARVDNRPANHNRAVSSSRLRLDLAPPSSPQSNVPSSDGSILVSSGGSATSLKTSPRRNPSQPTKIYSPTEERAASVIQAGVRGYLVRRLLKTNKVIDLKKIICDSVVCAKKLHMEESVTQADVTLHVRLIRQVTAACFELHSIFFEWPVKEQMALIRQDRILAIKALERKRLSSNDLMSKSEMKLSPVTRQLASPRSGEVSLEVSYNLGSCHETHSWS